MERFCRWFGQAQYQRISTLRLQKGRALARRARDPHTRLKQYRVQWGQLARVSRVDEFMLMDARRHSGCCRAVCPPWGQRDVQSEIATRLTSAFWAGDRLHKAAVAVPNPWAVTQVEGNAQTSSRTRSTELAAFRSREDLPFEGYFIHFCITVFVSYFGWTPVIPSNLFSLLDD